MAWHCAPMKLACVTDSYHLQLQIVQKETEVQLHKVGIRIWYYGRKPNSYSVLSPNASSDFDPMKVRPNTQYFCQSMEQPPIFWLTSNFDPKLLLPD